MVVKHNIAHKYIPDNSTEKVNFLLKYMDYMAEYDTKNMDIIRYHSLPNSIQMEFCNEKSDSANVY